MTVSSEMLSDSHRQFAYTHITHMPITSLPHHFRELDQTDGKPMSAGPYESASIELRFVRTFSPEFGCILDEHSPFNV